MKSRTLPLRLSMLAVFVFGTFFILNSSVARAAYFVKDTNGALTTNLISYYRMEGDSTDFWGSTNGTDVSMSYGSSYGKVNEGAGLNGSTSYSHTAPIIPSGTSAVSVSAWVKLNSLPFPGAYVIWSQTNDGSNGDFQIGVNTSGFFVNAINNSGTHYQKSVGSLPATSTWYNVVGTFGSGQITLYVNGTNEGSVSVPGTIGSSDNAQIGRQDLSGYYYYLPGDIDEVGVWTKTLSSQEISDLYNGGVGDGMVPQSFYAQIKNTPNGRWLLRSSPATSTTDNLVERLPEDWIVYVSSTLNLGGHVKTGHLWPLQNRPVDVLERTRLFLTCRG